VESSIGAIFKRKQVRGFFYSCILVLQNILNIKSSICNIRKLMIMEFHPSFTMTRDL
jgi:hypothetical protein